MAYFYDPFFASQYLHLDINAYRIYGQKEPDSATSDPVYSSQPPGVHVHDRYHFGYDSHALADSAAYSAPTYDAPVHKKPANKHEWFAT
ncbi:hypothetical protein DV735_g2707, partial [Chaetothyriales sp. CBS 134920]